MMGKKAWTIIAAVAIAAVGIPIWALDGGSSLPEASALSAGAEKIAYASAGEPGQTVQTDQQAAASSSSQDPQEESLAWLGACYTDADGNGICDRFAAGGAACGGYVDADGDGVCDACGCAAVGCQGFVDADGDGVCDVYESGVCNGGVCAGGGACGCEYRNGNGYGCDYGTASFENGLDSGNGTGYGRGYGYGYGRGLGRGCGRCCG